MNADGAPSGWRRVQDRIFHPRTKKGAVATLLGSIVIGLLTGLLADELSENARGAAPVRPAVHSRSW